jgi:hypothetical protein
MGEARPASPPGEERRTGTDSPDGPTCAAHNAGYVNLPPTTD